MTLKQLAKTLNQPIGNLIRKARQVGLQVGQNSPLTEAQIELLKATDVTPQLKPAQASEELEANQEMKSADDFEQSGELEIKQEETPAAPPQNQSIAGIKQQQLSQAIQAEQELNQHQTETRLQQRFADGQFLGVLEALTENQGRVSGYLAVNQVSFNADMQRREQALAKLAEKMAG